MCQLVDFLGGDTGFDEWGEVVEEFGMRWWRAKFAEIVWGANDAFAEGFNPLALEAVAWTRQQRSPVILPWQAALRSSRNSRR